MTDWNANDWETALIADLRANGGRPSQGPLAGNTIMLLWTTGAKSGQERRSLLTYSRDGEDYVVAGSAGGAPTDPKWIANVRANPKVRVEAANETFDATARVVDDPAEHERLWNQHVATWAHFAAYPEKAGRQIPVVVITRAS